MGSEHNGERNMSTAADSKKQTMTPEEIDRLVSAEVKISGMKDIKEQFSKDCEKLKACCATRKEASDLLETRREAVISARIKADPSTAKRIKGGKTTIAARSFTNSRYNILNACYGELETLATVRKAALEKVDKIIEKAEDMATEFPDQKSFKTYVKDAKKARAEVVRASGKSGREAVKTALKTARKTDSARKAAREAFEAEVSAHETTKTYEQFVKDRPALCADCKAFIQAHVDGLDKDQTATVKGEICQMMAILTRPID